MNKVIVFAGTTEGREICSFLKKYEIASLACTATEYGKCRIEEGGALTVRSGRLTEEEMEQLFWRRTAGNGYRCNPSVCRSCVGKYPVCM